MLTIPEFRLLTRVAAQLGVVGVIAACSSVTRAGPPIGRSAAGCPLASDSVVRMVQVSGEFRDAANRIARRTYSQLPEYQDAEIARICGSLSVFMRSEAIEIVYGEAYETGHVVPLYFGVDSSGVQLLSRLGTDSLLKGLNKEVWNAYILRGGKASITSGASAAQMGCLLHTLQTDRFPFEGCSFYEPVEAIRVDSGWEVRLNEATIRLSAQGAIRE